MEVNSILKDQSFYTIWSGSIEPLADSRKLVAFTALERSDHKHNFIQNIALAISKDGNSVDEVIYPTLSSPRKDWEMITKKGYYLSSIEKLGSDSGEERGPILAWRDPFIFKNADGKTNLFWAGKVAPKRSALVRAELEYNGTSFSLKKLYPPVTVSDGDDFTQLELPKVIHDPKGGWYYLIISTCNRIYEGQLDEEVEKQVRVYKSKSLDEQWQLMGKILKDENLFGPTVLSTDFKNNRLLCIAPFTDAAKNDLRLTFSSPFYLYLDNLRVEFL